MTDALRSDHLRDIACAQLQLAQAGEILNNYRSTGRAFYKDASGRDVLYDLSMFSPDGCEQVLQHLQERAAQHLHLLLHKHYSPSTMQNN